MEFKKEFVTRTIILIIGFLIIANSLFSIYSQVEPKVELIMNSNIFEITELDKIIIFQNVILILIGILIINIATQWKEIFKSMAKTLISFSVLFLIFSVFFYSFNSHVDDITDSIQPSIDLILANSIDSTLENQFNLKQGRIIDLVLFENIETETISVNSITQNQANEIADPFDLNNYSNEDKITFSKILISLMFDEINNNPDISIETPIPLSSTKELISNQGVDLSLLKILDISTIGSFFDINQNAYINILKSTNQETKTINTNSISKNDVNLIWNNLGFNDSISFQTKETLIKIILSYMSDEMSNSGFSSSTPIPLASISNMIPPELNKLISYDILNENISKRANSLNSIRLDCKNNILNFSQVCDMISVTEYNNFMTFISNQSNTESLNLPLDVAPSLEKFNTIEKLNDYLKENTSKYKNYIFISLALFILAFISYYAHFAIFNRELVFIHIPYYLLRVATIYYFISFFFLSFFYYFLNSEYLTDFILNITSIIFVG